VVDVKVPALPPLPPDVELHVVALAGRLLEVARQTLMGQDWPDGLRNTHFRLLSLLPASGTTITDMATVLCMTKQAVGQFVAQLQDSGHLEVRIDEQDRRRRLVVRTARGDEVVERVNATIGALERHWSGRVGPERYRAFLGVLEQIALDA
jgi:DNA-binding MarR family transcriptional regulator